jgi:hypothetical protein
MRSDPGCSTHGVEWLSSCASTAGNCAQVAFEKTRIAHRSLPNAVTLVLTGIHISTRGQAAATQLPGIPVLMPNVVNSGCQNPECLSLHRTQAVAVRPRGDFCTVLRAMVYRRHHP